MNIAFTQIMISKTFTATMKAVKVIAEKVDGSEFLKPKHKLLKKD